MFAQLVDFLAKKMPLYSNLYKGAVVIKTAIVFAVMDLSKEWKTFLLQRNKIISYLLVNLLY